VLHSLDGYDEISLTSNFKMISNEKEQILEPEQIGFKRLKQEDLFGGDTVEDSAKIFMSILKGNGTDAQNNVVIANSAMAIHCVKTKSSFEECVADAKEALESKKALNVFVKLTSN
jgi:anthranilate phosphoribosyltransferase